MFIVQQLNKPFDNYTVYTVKEEDGKLWFLLHYRYGAGWVWEPADKFEPFRD